MVPELDHPGREGVGEFFSNQCVFITGATGFLGKALVEKLLRSCSGVQKIFVLVRASSREDAQGRLAQMLDCALFDKLRQEDSKAFDKIAVIRGDLAEPSLGISEQDRNTLISQVNTVIHSGATVKFNEKIKLAMKINVGGTLSLIRLCKEMTHLKAFVHVSTAFANCDRSTIDEVIYDVMPDPYTFMENMEQMDDTLADCITPGVINKKPNTYTFTKALGEQLLALEGHDLPVCIVRPAIVSSTAHEPMPGWIDNYSGATGLMAATGKGMLHTVLLDPYKVFDFIPLDYVVNLIIASAWYTSLSKSHHFKVYHSWTGSVNPLLSGEMMHWVIEYFRQSPPSGVIMYPFLNYGSKLIPHKLFHFGMHLTPAFIMDLGARVIGAKPKMMRIIKKICKLMDAQQYFMSNVWEFKTNNVLQLQDRLTPADNAIYNCNVKNIYWPKYMENYVKGIRLHLFKERDDNLVQARKHMDRVFWIQVLLAVTLCGIVGFGFNLVVKTVGY